MISHAMAGQDIMLGWLIARQTARQTTIEYALMTSQLMISQSMREHPAYIYIYNCENTSCDYNRFNHSTFIVIC